MNPKVGDSSPPQVDTFSVSKTFTRTPVRMSKMNAVVRAQLTFQMFNFTSKIHTAPRGQRTAMAVPECFAVVLLKGQWIVHSRNGMIRLVSKYHRLMSKYHRPVSMVPFLVMGYQYAPQVAMIKNQSGASVWMS